MTKTKRRVIWLLLVLAVSIPLAIWLYGQLQIDKCLDAGGAWNYEQQSCILETPRK